MDYTAYLLTLALIVAIGLVIAGIAQRRFDRKFSAVLITGMQVVFVTCVTYYNFTVCADITSILLEPLRLLFQYLLVFAVFAFSVKGINKKSLKSEWAEYKRSYSLLLAQLVIVPVWVTTILVASTNDWLLQFLLDHYDNYFQVSGMLVIGAAFILFFVSLLQVLPKKVSISS